MTSNELAQSIKQAAEELHQMVSKIYQSEVPLAIERDLVKQKCIALYELLLLENKTPETIHYPEEETQKVDETPHVETPALPLEIPLLVNDVPESVLETPTPITQPTPTEQLNLEIDAVIETQNTIRENETPAPKEVINELSLHEKIANTLPPQPVLADKLTSIPNLKNAINVNLKIAIVNQLFKENTVEYVKAIDKLNSSENIHEALRYFTELKHTYDWDNENMLVKDLEQLIQKRFA